MLGLFQNGGIQRPGTVTLRGFHLHPAYTAFVESIRAGEGELFDHQLLLTLPYLIAVDVEINGIAHRFELSDLDRIDDFISIFSHNEPIVQGAPAA